jgi:hypothetical protein
MRKLNDTKKLVMSSTQAVKEVQSVRLKEKVPKISEGDFKAMLEKYPLNKAEIMTYLLKLHQTDMQLSQKFFEYLKMQN